MILSDLITDDTPANLLHNRRLGVAGFEFKFIATDAQPILTEVEVKFPVVDSNERPNSFTMPCYCREVKEAARLIFQAFSFVEHGMRIHCNSVRQVVGLPNVKSYDRSVRLVDGAEKVCEVLAKTVSCGTTKSFVQDKYIDLVIKKG